MCLMEKVEKHEKLLMSGKLNIESNKKFIELTNERFKRIEEILEKELKFKPPSKRKLNEL